jgi:hypothetical protein
VEKKKTKVKFQVNIFEVIENIITYVRKYIKNFYHYFTFSFVP